MNAPCEAHKGEATMEAGRFTYDYNASALGLGGVLKHHNGATTVIPSLASVRLAPTGGEGSAEVSNYDKDGVSFSTAHSSVRGYDSEYRTFTTTSEVYMTNLNLFGRLQVAILESSISSTRDVFENGELTAQADPDNARFSMKASILGLKIDGVEVIPKFDFELSACSTYALFTDRISGDGLGTYAQQFGVEEEALQTALTAQVQPIRASFVSDLQHVPTSQFGPRRGFKLPVKNFGTVHFGELVVRAGHRHVNMLRIEFDSAPSSMFAGAGDGDAVASPAGGWMTVVNHDSNGAPTWP